MEIEKIFLITIIVLIGSLVTVGIVLELLSRVYECKGVFPKEFTTSCPRSPRPSNLSKNKKFIADLKEKRSRSEKISKQKYGQAADLLILEVEPAKLSYRFNGVACSSHGYVRNDLPERAKNFVKRHELEHLLQTHQERNTEFSANLAAAREYPLGLVQTIFFSLKNRASFYDSKFCYILSLWKTFKVYFLPVKYIK